MRTKGQTSAGKRKSTPTVAKKKSSAPGALVVYGGWKGHDPEACAKRVAEWMKEKGFKVTLSDSMDPYLDARFMSRQSVVVPTWTMGEISAEQSQGLREAILAGTGLAGWHGGMCDAFRGDTAYQFMTGGQWVAHPGNIINYTVDHLDPEHPITRGLRPFKMHSEQYFMHVDPGNEVLATTTFSGRHGGVPWIKGTVMPVVWIRKYGKGRVFYTGLGHVDADFEVPEVFEIVKRGIQWAARRKIAPEYASK